MNKRETERLAQRAERLMGIASRNGVKLAPKAKWNCTPPERVDKFYPPAFYGYTAIDALNNQISEAPFDPETDVLLDIRPRRKEDKPLGGSTMVRVRFQKKAD
jgi:hypothetical protein